MGKAQREKGKRGERQVANLLKPVLGGHVTRGVGQSQSGSNQADVEGAPYWIEVKTGKRPNIMAAMQQAREATDGRVPVVFSKRDREKWLVTMESDAWLELLRLAYGKDDAEG